MTLAAKGTIRFKKDTKPSDCPWQIGCKQLEIKEGGSGDLEEMIEQLTDKVREKLTEEFRAAPRSVMVVGYSMSLDFEVIGPVNHILSEFGQYKATIRLADGTEFDMDRLTATADKVLAYARRTGKTPEQVLDEAKAELTRQKDAEKRKAES